MKNILILGLIVLLPLNSFAIGGVANFGALGSITTADIDDGAVTTAKLGNGSVTTPKLHIEALDGFAGKVDLSSTLTVAGRLNQNDQIVQSISVTDYATTITNNHATSGYGLRVQAGDDANVINTTFRDYAGTTLMNILGNGNVGIGTASPAADLHVDGTSHIGAGASVSSFTAIGFIPHTPTAQTIAAGNTVTADACGGLKVITAAGAVTTSTTDTFTAVTVANAGCCMDVLILNQTVTLDANANFGTEGGADVVIAAGDMVRVCAEITNTKWYQVSPKSDN